jgi:hypothetical protein
MKTLKIMMLLFLLIGSASIVKAQQKEKPSPQKVANRQTNWMVTELKLDESQKAKVAAINLDYATKIAEVRANEPDPDVKRQKLKSLNKARMEAIKAVISEDQYKLLVIKLAEKKKDRQNQ